MYKILYIIYNLMATPSFHRPRITINDPNHKIMNDIIIINIFGTLRSSSPSPT